MVNLGIRSTTLKSRSQIFKKSIDEIHVIRIYIIKIFLSFIIKKY